MQHVPGERWSKTYNGWTIPDTFENRNKCKLPLNLPTAGKQMLPADSQKPTNKSSLVYINENNKQQLQNFLQQLALKAYSPSTIRTYRNEFIQLLQLLNNAPVKNLTYQHLQRYLLYCIHKGLKENTLHSRINALKFYYEQVLHKEKFFFEIPRPKRPPAVT